MIIDDLNGLGKFQIIPNVFLQDATVFRVNENLHDFLKSNIKLDNYDYGDIQLSSWLPYQNTVLQFNDCLDWYYEEESDNGRVIWNLSYYSDNCPPKASMHHFINEMKQDLQGHYEKVVFKGITFGMLKKNGQPHVGNLTRMEFSEDLTMVDSKLYAYVLDECSIDVRLQLKQLPHHENIPLSGSYLVHAKESHHFSGKYSAFTLFKFLGFLACNNTSAIKNNPATKIQEKRLKKGKLPLISYYTLQLRDKLSGSDSERSNSIWSNRVHLCRGHMRSYSDESPLFGKYSGKFWIAPHLRGDKKLGLIYKDYSLHTEGADK